jgi:UDP-N-acetyl-D-mannosaminuronic acid dehydrogenase
LKKVLATGRLDLSADGSILQRTSQIVVVIGTPVDEFLAPSMTVFERAVNQISPHLRPSSLVVLRSTVYPGTTAM